MAPSKKRKRDEAIYTCQTCLTDRIESRFPDTTPTDECKHLINTCTVCLRDWIKSKLGEVAISGGIPCPECEELIVIEGVESVSSKVTIKKFIDLDRRRIENSTPGWFWCLSPACQAGKVHDYILGQQGAEQNDHVVKKTRTGSQTTAVASKKAGKATRSNATLFICDECQYESCVSCAKPWHSGETCESYKKRTSGHHELEEYKSLKTVNRISKKCPTCSTPIIRNGGCNHMSCVRCRASWCWNCNEVFAGGCRCSREAIAAAQERQVEERRWLEDLPEIVVASRPQ